MSNEQPPGVDADSIQPTSREGRVFSTLSYLLMWWSSLIVVQAFLGFVSKHSFAAFAWSRIALGVLLLVLLR